MGRGASGREAGLQPIAIDNRWYFNPNNADFEIDPQDVVRNPIRFVGVPRDTELAELFEGYGTVQDEYRYNVEVNINRLQTLQPFVLRSGVNNPSDEGAPYAVLIDGNYYLVDGNHRVARALLRGDRTVRLDVSVRRRV